MLQKLEISVRSGHGIVINDAKAKILQKLGASPLCKNFEIVSIDLKDAEQSLGKELSAKGFDDKEPTVFVAEGLIMYLADGAWKFLTDVMNISCGGSVFILNFMDGGAHVPTGPNEERLKEHFGTSWEFEFYKYGEEGLNFGRFDTNKFPPSAAFSFMVARKKRS